MKKATTLFALLAFLLNVAFAQDATKRPQTNKKTEKEQKAEKEKKETKVRRTEHPDNSGNYIEVPDNDPKDLKKEAAGSEKKEGTPDKRYKENKEPKKKATDPKKKAAMPDKRYKENKKVKKK